MLCSSKGLRPARKKRKEYVVFLLYMIAET
jgi:hypothetical protein